MGIGDPRRLRVLQLVMVAELLPLACNIASASGVREGKAEGRGVLERDWVRAGASASCATQRKGE
ncbi:hypothetical protein Dimus_037028, partial [Dionaea muscipula]